MKISNHWLEATSNAEKINISRSPNAQELIDPDYLVIHYTATDTASSAIDWFMNSAQNPDRIVAHIVLDTDGTITQLVPFNRRANHAGTSTWDGVDQFNFHSIGIELVNPGFVEKISDGSFKRRTGTNSFKMYPASMKNKIIAAKHKHKFWTAKENSHWFMFPPAQLNALYQLAALLISNYQLVAAVGHDDISPARKPDPGPAFPWNTFKANVLGAPDDIGKIFTVNTEGTNFRNDASTNAAVIKKLSKGYELGLIGKKGQWSKVYLVNDAKEVLQKKGSINRSVKNIGWIFSDLLSVKPEQ